MSEQRFVCKYCGSTVELRPQYDVDAPKRWIHVPSLDYRCLLFAEPLRAVLNPCALPCRGGHLMNWWREYFLPRACLAGFCVTCYLFWSGAWTVVPR